MWHHLYSISSWPEDDWQGAIDHCNASEYQDYDDWELPTVYELSRLLRYGENKPATEFPSITEANDEKFWTRTDYDVNPIYAWIVDFNDGAIDRGRKDGASRSIICVRGGSTSPSNPPARFVISKSGQDDVILDRTTGLEWQAPPSNQITETLWKEALEECETSSYGNHNDWRLPNVNELRSLVDYDESSMAVHPDIEEYFVGVDKERYWSSSPYIEKAYYAWAVNFESGPVEKGAMAYMTYSVRCVRGGQ